MAAFFAAGLAELPHGFLDEHPPFGAMLFTPFHFRIRSVLRLVKQTKDVVRLATVTIADIFNDCQLAS